LRGRPIGTLGRLLPIPRCVQGGFTVGLRYGILGAGRQGTAAAYDLIVRGEAESLILGDLGERQSAASADRVNQLTKSNRARGVRVDAADHDALVQFLRPLDAFVSSASWRLNLAVSRAALEAGTHMCDLGGNTEVVRGQLELDRDARTRGICLVPDCGEAPGLASNLLAYALTLLDRTDELLLLDGGLPCEPVPPWNYVLTFNVDGLTNEYDGRTTWLEDGELVEVDCLDPATYELIEFGPPLGTLEAFAAATGSTTPWTLRDRVRTLRAKVLRYPGHAAQFRAFRELGLFSEQPVDAGRVKVVPRDAFHRLLEPMIRAQPGTNDVVVARVLASGTNGGRDAQAVVDLRVYSDDVLGFTAMEQATGWHAAIVCHLMAMGGISPGATPVEIAVDPKVMVDELRARGFDLTTRVE
jgi:lysine 6-dehydrogenase